MLTVLPYTFEVTNSGNDRPVNDYGRKTTAVDTTAVKTILAMLRLLGRGCGFLTPGASDAPQGALITGSAHLGA
jgi:hypothetical protein